MTVDQAFEACRRRALVRATDTGDVGILAALGWDALGETLMGTLREFRPTGELDGPYFAHCDVLDLERIEVYELAR